MSQEGVSSFTADLSRYNTLIVFACDKGAAAQKLVDLPVGQIPKRNLALSMPLDENKVYTESRNTSTVLKYESHFIQDMTSTEVQTVDDLKKVS